MVLFGKIYSQNISEAIISSDLGHQIVMQDQKTSKRNSIVYYTK